MASRMGKTSVKDKVAGGLRKIFATAAAATMFLGVPGYHLYGSIEETEAKVVSYDSGYKWDNDKGEGVYNFKIKTNKGTFVDKKSLLHLKSQDDTDKIWFDTKIGETYKFKTYGMDVGPFEKNIISMEPVTEEELKERARMKQEAMKAAKQEALKQQKPQGQTVDGVVPANNAGAVAPVAQQQGLSGRVQTIDIVHNNNVIQLTVPVEAAGKVTINNVTPLALPPAAPRPPGT